MPRCYIDPRVAAIAASKDRLDFWRAELALATDANAAETARRCVARYEQELRRFRRASREDAWHLCEAHLPSAGEHGRIKSGRVVPTLHV